MLTGAVTPSGKLPVTFVHDDADAQPSGPCMGEASGHCVYSEGLHVAWRGLHTSPVGFPFGHGLSYTSFSYAWRDGVPAPAWATAAGGGGGVSLSVTVSNTGGVRGAEVAQVYVRYPASAGEPDLVLRAFEKTRVLDPGESQTLAFELPPLAFSAWRPAATDR